MIIFVFIQEYKGIILLCEDKLLLRNLTIEYLIFSDSNLYNRSSMHVQTLQLKSIFIAMRFKELKIWKQLYWKVLA